MTKKIKKAFFNKKALFRSLIWHDLAFRLTEVSTETGAAGFTLMTVLFKLVEKATGGQKLPGIA